MPKRLHQLGFFLTFTLLLLFSRQASSQCNNTSSFGSVAAPTTSTPVTITTCAFGGEYSTVTGCVAGSSYTFTGTGGTGNYLTIRQGTSGGTVLGFGFSPVTVTCTVSGSLFLHFNTNAACGTESVCHTGTVSCTSCGSGTATACTNSSSFGSATIDPGGSVVTISSCSFAGEYSTINGAVSGQILKFTSSAAGDNITIRSGTPSGPVVGFGFTPLTVTNNFTGTLYAHWNTAGCGSQSTCRTTTVQYLGVATCQNTSQFPSSAVSLATTNSTGAAQTVTSCNFAGDYYQLTNVVSGKSYTLTSSVATDFLTVRVGTAGGTILTSGTVPLVVNATSASDLFVHINTNSSCGTQSTCRTTTVQCTNCLSTPACATAPTSPANGATGICPNTAVTLSWPSVSGATSYDVYFGTAASPPLVTNTSGTTYAAGSLTAGTYFWQIRPKNASGTAAGCTVWSFTVSDVTPPSITCPANISNPNSPSTACNAVVTYSTPNGSDNCGLGSVSITGGQVSGTTFPVGVTTNTWRATDVNGNTATCSFTVTVTDATLPSISCPANITTNSNVPGTCNAVVSYTTPTGSDNCGLSSITQTSGLPSGGTFPSGTTTNVWRATDVNGNTSSCSFTVTVNDATPPTISCPSSISTTNNPATACSAVVTYTTQRALTTAA
ncbi:MAG: HYR domain-containing protein [Bacteroidota bacterium]